MHICSMCKYKVLFFQKFSYRYIDDFGDIEFKTERCRWSKRFDGFNLIKFLSNYFLDSSIFDISFVDNKIIFDYFNPSTGETNILTLTIKELIS